MRMQGGSAGRKPAMPDIDGDRFVRGLECRDCVNRTQITSYGLSDVSGRPIPQAGLKAICKPICTLKEDRALVGNSGH